MLKFTKSLLPLIVLFFRCDFVRAQIFVPAVESREKGQSEEADVQA